MNKPRRGATAAMETNPSVEAFIELGVAAKESKQESVNRIEDENLTEESKPGVIKNDIGKGQRKTSNARPKKLLPETTTWATATLSKATIQKTVRFNPQLVARWEELNQSIRCSGQSPRSFQQVQNEAFELWLNSNQA